MLEQILNNISQLWHIYLILAAIFSTFIGFITWLNSTYKQIRQCVKTISTISEQFQNNSGSTIKDLLDRVEDKANKIEFMIHVYLDMIPTPIFVADSSGRCTWANKSYLKLVDMELVEVVGTGWELMICDDDREYVIKEWYKACAEVRPFHMRYNICNNDRRIYVKCESYGKKEIGYIGFLTEVK